jgi:hypothetical protein
MDLNYWKAASENWKGIKHMLRRIKTPYQEDECSMNLWYNNKNM